ncbi:Pogo transposable element with KRAB domain [Frankliniella fusca]|uniref:Pogo transposable element with KRAB domain n=1 Tax=Frankliniella fusca TaxID=407009 RepID=A0AAE1HVL1_9NEOP|nr:Pogo transposable element with KRAB domain [Frankliniella fusca]
MVRNYKKKTDRKPNTPRKLRKGLELLKQGYSLRVAAKEANVNYACLFRLSKKTKDCKTDSEISDDALRLSHNSRSIFTNAMEESIAQYCTDMALIGYGLTTLKVRELAYETAMINKIKVPDSWTKETIAGLDWLHGFQRRHPQLSIRTPEGCSIARAQAFNKPNVEKFFDKLAEVMQRHPGFADGSRVGNLDETSSSTVQNTRKIISPKGVKQVHKIKSAERGISVTTCCTVMAYGMVLPPVMIFPRKKFVNHMLTNCFPGTLGLANENGYMTKETFVSVLNHVIKCTNSSKENPCLLLVDNVESHLSAEALTLAKENGVTMLTFPPYCTHKMQPLDVSFFGPFKAYYDAAVNSWILSNPAIPVTIYNIAGFVKTALSRAGSVETVTAGFKKTGIYPFDRNVFKDSDFVMAQVTLQPDPSCEQLSNTEKTVSTPPSPVPESSATPSEDIPSPSKENFTVPSDRPPSTSFISPMEFKGLPKAKPKADKRKVRKKGKCRIATDTPEKEEIEAKEKETKEKKTKREENRKKREIKRLTEEVKQTRKKKTRNTRELKRKLSFRGEESDDTDGAENDLTVNTKDAHHPEKFDGSSPPQQAPQEGDYVLVLFQAKDSKYYVGKIIKDVDEAGDYEISYLRTAQKSNNMFTLPNVPDLCSVSKSDIKAILPQPCHHQGMTKRQKSYISFQFDFSTFHLG